MAALHHQSPAVEETVTAAQTRVTAQELAEAVAALERRREETAQHLEGTIPLGEVVQQLGLEATPEEILAEVEAQRRAAAARQKPSRHWRRWALGGMLALVCGVTVLSGVHNAPPTEYVAVETGVAIPSPVSSQTTDNLLILDRQGARPVLRTLGEIGDDHPVQAGASTVFSLLKAEDQLGSSIDAREESKRWTLVKHGGKVYLRGWLAVAVSPQAMRTSPITVHSAPGRLGKNAVPITVPLDTARVEGGSLGSDPETINLTNIRLDEHSGQ